MKQHLANILAIALIIFAVLPAMAIDSPAFYVKIEGTSDIVGTQSTLVLNWQIMANHDGLNLKNTQGLRLAYDNRTLQLMKWDGASVIDGSGIGTEFVYVSGVGAAGGYDRGATVFAARDATGSTGYLSLALGDPNETYECTRGTYVSMLRVRFAFREGKSASDLTSGSIRLMSVAELSATNQSAAIIISTDENGDTFYEYLRQSGGEPLGGDTLNAPTVVYPGSVAESKPGTTGNEPALPGSEPDTPQDPEEPPSANWINPYEDVREPAWYCEAVQYATEEGLMNGTGDNRFSPDGTMTRAMFATVIHRLAGQPETDGKSPFTDVPDGQWYSKAIIWASANGIILGYGDNRFGLIDNVTREQIVAILYRYAANQGMDIGGQSVLDQYDDAGEISSWALPAMKWAVGCGVISGRSDNELAPLRSITRAEVAQVLYRFRG